MVETIRYGIICVYILYNIFHIYILFVNSTLINYCYYTKSTYVVYSNIYIYFKIIYIHIVYEISHFRY